MLWSTSHNSWTLSFSLWPHKKVLFFVFFLRLWPFGSIASTQIPLYYYYMLCMIALDSGELKNIRGMIKDKNRDRWKTFNHRIVVFIVYA